MKKTRSQNQESEISFRLPVQLGNSCYGTSVWTNDEPLVIGDITTNLGLPPFPVKYAEGGNIIRWSASFEVTASVGVDLSQLDPLGLLGLKTPEVHAQLYYAPALTGTPITIADTVYYLVDDINLGEIPTAGETQAYTASKSMSLSPYTVTDDGYIMVRFYIDSELASSLTGFHAQAYVNIN